LYNKIEQDLEEKKELLKKKPEVPAEWDFEIPKEVRDIVYKELVRKGIDPGNVSLRVDNLNSNIVAGTTYSTDPRYYAIIIFNRLSFVVSSDSPRKKIEEMGLQIANLHEPVHVQCLHPLKGDYIKEAECIGKDQIMLSLAEKRCLMKRKRNF